VVAAADRDLLSLSRIYNLDLDKSTAAPPFVRREIWNIHVHKVCVYEVYAHKLRAQEVHAYDVYACEVQAYEMHAREVLAKTFRSPTLQTMW
jgi:hypothetical protein